MATKEILDLQLIAAVTTGLSIPGDDGIQTYRFTAAQMKAFILANENILLPALKTDIFSGLTVVTAADDDHFPIIDTSDADKTKKALVSSFARNSYRGIASATTLNSGDSSVLLSGASFTLTLPTAVGIAGKRFKIFHGGTNFTQIYTLATTSGQTINGIASGDYSLCTNGEVLEIESDGVNYLIVNSFTSTGEIDCGAIPFTTEGTANAKGGTPAIDKIILTRRGRFGRMRINYRQTSAGTAGTGAYYFGFPTGIVADTTNLATTSNPGTGAPPITDYPSIIGTAFANNGSRGLGACYLRTNAKFYATANVEHTLASAVINAGHYQLSIAGTAYHFDVEIPVVGWRP